MTEPASLPPAPPKPDADRTGLLVACATIIILAALAGSGYLLKQELDRMANAKPAAPPEVTQALKDLKTQLDQQRADSATQLQTLQTELTAMKEQQAAQTPPDMDAAIAPVQEKLDAIAAQLQEAPKAEPEVVQSQPADTTLEIPVAQPADTAQLALRDYLALRRTAEAGGPYARELAALIPQLPASEIDAVGTLQHYAEQGIGEDDEEVDAPSQSLRPWMETVNAKLRGLVSIKPSATPRATPQARAEVIAALDRIEASLMGTP